MTRILFVYADADEPLIDRLQTIAGGCGLKSGRLKIAGLDTRQQSELRTMLEAADRVIIVWSPDTVRMQSVINLAERAANANRLFSLKTKRLGKTGVPFGLGPAPTFAETEISDWAADWGRFRDALFPGEDAWSGVPDKVSLSRTLEPPPDEPSLGATCLAVSPNGRIVAGGGWWKGIRMWDANSGRLLQSLEGPEQAVRAVAFSPNGEFVAAGGDDHVVRLWRVRDGRPTDQLCGHETAIRCLAFTANGKKLISGSEEKLVSLFGDEKTLRLWDVADGTCLHDFSAYSTGPEKVAVLEKENLLVCGGNGLCFFDLGTGELLYSVESVGSVFSLDVSNDGQMIALTGYQPEVKLWDVRRNQIVRTLEGQSAKVNSVAFSPNGRALVSGGDDKMLKLWLARSGRLVRTFHGHQNTIEAAVFSPDGQIIFSASRDGTIGIWDAPNLGE